MKSNAKLKDQLEAIGLEVQEKNSTYKLLALEINQCKELARRVENDKNNIEQENSTLEAEIKGNKATRKRLETTKNQLNKKINDTESE